MSAAPLLTFTAKWSGGQTLDRLHLGLGVVVAENEARRRTVLMILQEDVVKMLCNVTVETRMSAKRWGYFYSLVCNSAFI